MTFDPDKHLAVIREAGTGKHKHVPLRDLVDKLNGIGLKALPEADPRVEQLCSEVSHLQERVSALGNGGPSHDPRIDELIPRVAFIEHALKSLVIRALNEAEA